MLHPHWSPPRPPFPMNPHSRQTWPTQTTVPNKTHSQVYLSTDESQVISVHQAHVSYFSLSSTHVQRLFSHTHTHHLQSTRSVLSSLTLPSLLFCITALAFDSCFGLLVYDTCLSANCSTFWLFFLVIVLDLPFGFFFFFCLSRLSKTLNHNCILSCPFPALTVADCFTIFMNAEDSEPPGQSYCPGTTPWSTGAATPEDECPDPSAHRDPYPAHGPAYHLY